MKARKSSNASQPWTRISQRSHAFRRQRSTTANSRPAPVGQWQTQMLSNGSTHRCHLRQSPATSASPCPVRQDAASTTDWPTPTMLRSRFSIASRHPRRGSQLHFRAIRSVQSAPSPADGASDKGNFDEPNAELARRWAQPKQPHPHDRPAQSGVSIARSAATHHVAAKNSSVENGRLRTMSISSTKMTSRSAVRGPWAEGREPAIKRSSLWNRSIFSRMEIARRR